MAAIIIVEITPTGIGMVRNLAQPFVSINEEGPPLQNLTVGPWKLEVQSSQIHYRGSHPDGFSIIRGSHPLEPSELCLDADLSLVTRSAGNLSSQLFRYYGIHEFQPFSPQRRTYRRNYRTRQRIPGELRWVHTDGQLYAEGRDGGHTPVEWKDRSKRYGRTTFALPPSSGATWAVVEIGYHSQWHHRTSAPAYLELWSAERDFPTLSSQLGQYLREHGLTTFSALP